jgi:hypothetical protein
MDAVTDELYVILDDYHLLTDAGVTAAMTHLAEDLPHRAHRAGPVPGVVHRRGGGAVLLAGSGRVQAGALSLI